MLIETEAVTRAIRSHKLFYKQDHEDRVIDQTIQEMGELTQALIKLRYTRTERGENASERLARACAAITRVYDELADVLICLEFLGQWFRWSKDEVTSTVSSISTELDRVLQEQL